MDVNEAYDVLGVEPDADEKTVRRAYAKMAKTYRPDTHPEEFSRIRKAYDALLSLVKNDDYLDPGLPSPSTPMPTPKSNVSNIQEHLPSRRIVSYASDEGGFHEQTNPLQRIEDALIEALEVVKPGQLESEEKVVTLADDYLAASNHHTRELREYVEGFLVSICLGDDYLPHAVRERVADFSGLSSVVLYEDRLQPWEQEFLARFEESEQVEDLIAQAGSARNAAEHALVYDVSWVKALMLRLDVNKTNLINRWMNYTYKAYGESERFIHPGFQAKWARLQQVEPLDTFVILSFVVLMIISGLALEAFGVPLHYFFQKPIGSMLQMAAALAVLSWTNLILVQLARPVLRRYIGRVRDWVFTHVPTQLLVVEAAAVFLLIWGWVLDGILPNLVSTALVVGASSVLILAGVFARQWLWVNQLSLPFIALRVLLYFYVAVTFLDGFVRTDATTSSLWLVAGLVVWVAPPRLFFEWAENHKHKPEGAISLRYAKFSLSTEYPRWFIASTAMLCLIVATGLLFVEALSVISPIVFGVLLTVLAIELAISGGFHADSQLSTLRTAVAWGLFLTTPIIQGFIEPQYADFIAHLALSLFLIWSACYWLSPRIRVKIQG